MPIRVECDECGAKYNVDERRAGTEIPCKECDADIYVPEPRRGRGERAPRGGGARRERPAYARGEEFEYEEEHEGSNPAVFVVCLVAGALVLAGIVFGVMYAMKDDPAAQVAEDDPAEEQPVDPGIINSKPVAVNQNNNPINPNPNPINQNNNPVNPEPINPQPKPFERGPIPEPINPIAQNDPPAENPMPRGFQQGGEEVAELAPDLNVEWSVKFDPAPETIAFEDERKLRVPLPIGVEIQEVLWPLTPSYFVALGKNNSDRDVREVYDIRTRKKVGRIGAIRAWGAKPILSQDGKFFALSTRDTKGVFVWDIVASKGKGTLHFPADWGASALAFAGNKRILAAGSKIPLQVWTLPDGNPERSITLPDAVEEKVLACSHGGKYAAVYRKKQNEQAIHIYDLDTGELAGAIGVPLQGDNSFWTPGCHALMFSPDGEEIAGLFEESFQGKFFYSFSLKDGSLTFQHKLDDGGSPWWPDANATPIQWFPHKNRWLLFGNLLLDRQIGKVVWKFSVDEKTAASRRILNNEMMMGVTLESSKPTLTSFPVEEDKIAKAAETVGAGGELVDAKLPPLKAIDRAAVQTLTLDVGAGVWTAKPDPAPAGEPLKDTVSVTATGGHMRGLLLSNPQAGRAVIYSELRGTGIIPPRPGRNNPASGAFGHLDFYDLRTGRRSDPMDFEFPTKLAAFSPSGARVASILQPDQERLDIWTTADGKPALAFRPYTEEADKNHKKIQAVAFVDDEHVLTLSNQKKLVLWKLPECRAVYEIAEAAEPGLSPNQQYLAVSTGRGYLLLDSRTGKQVGAFNIEGTMHAATFHPDGTRFAASCTGPKGPTIVIWSMEDGGVLSEFPVQTTAQNMHFCDANHLLMNNETLVDVEHELIVWKYRLAGGAHSPQSPDGRHWYIAPKGASGAELIAAKLPEPKVAEALAMKTLKPEFLLEPGGKLTVQINLPDAGPGQANIRQRALENLVAKYQNHGTSVGGGSELVVTMDLTENNTGETQELILQESRTPFGGAFFPGAGGEKLTLPLLKIDCKITYTYQGKLLNEQKANFSNAVSSWFSERISQGKSPEQHLSEKMWNMASGYFTNYSPPVFVFRDFEGKGFGLSVLSDRGPLPQGVGG